VLAACAGCLRCCLCLLAVLLEQALLTDIRMVLQVPGRGLENTQEGLHNASRPQAAHLGSRHDTDVCCARFMGFDACD